METRDALKQRIKVMLVDNLMLRITADELADDSKLFGPDSLGLDSVDALQIVVALEKNFGLKVRDPGQAKELLLSVASITKAVEAHLAGSKPR